MKNDLQHVLARFSLRILYLASLAAGVCLGASALAQETNQPTVLKPVVVTGSLIPTAETVGPAPINIVTPIQIQAAGQQDVLSTLVKLDPAFSGSGNIGQVANNFSINGALPAGEANVAIRNLPTLVLLDGHRLVNSALSGGQLVDLNTIPLSIIDRVEVLKDGSSALYGSDAIGGVVNVITKKNYNGTEIGGRVGFPTRKDSNDILERQAYVIAGATTEDYSFFAGGQYYYMDPLLTKDRNLASAGIQELLNKGILPPAYFSPSYPGRVQDGNGSYILAGSPFAAGTSNALYQYNPSVITPPVVPGFSVGNSANPIDDYNTAAFNLYGYRPYIPMGQTPIGSALDALDPTGDLGLNGFYPLLNTTQYGVHSIQTQDRRNFFSNFERDLFGKNLQVFGSFLYANDLSQGLLAPSPMVSLNLYNIFVPANNQFNPFGIDLGTGGSGTPRIRSRFVDYGNRIFDAQSDTYHFVGGLRGQINPKYDWEGSYTYNRADQSYQYVNAENGAGLNNSFIGTLTDPLGNPLPSYNIFSLPGFNLTNAPATINTTKTTLFTTGVSESWATDGHVHGTPFDLPAGPFDAVVGAQYFYEKISLAVDGLQQLGLVPGLNQAFPFPGGKRDRWAIYEEVKIPVMGENFNLPGIYMLDVDCQGRYERLFPGGDSGVPKVQVRWQPIDKNLIGPVTIRGGYSESFLAPSVYSLFGPDFVSNPVLSLPGGSGQVQTQNRANPNLPPSNAYQWNVGLVYSPKMIKGLTVSVDYYNIQQNNLVVPGDPQAAANSLNALGSASPFAPGFTFFDKTHLTTTAPNQVNANNWGNLILYNQAAASLRTDGIDLAANYELPFVDYGKITLMGNANITRSYELSALQGAPYYRYEGQWTANFGTAQGTIPDYRLNFGLTWEYKDFTYSILAHYIPGITDYGFLHPQAGGDVQGFTLNNQPWKVPDYYTIDMRIAYAFTQKWGKILNGTTLAVGCNNITDEDPPLIASALEDNTDKGTYDLLGRFVYFEVSHKF